MRSKNPTLNVKFKFRTRADAAGQETGDPAGEKTIDFRMDADGLSTRRPQVYTQMLASAGAALQSLDNEQCIGTHYSISSAIETVLDMLPQWKSRVPWHPCALEQTKNPAQSDSISRKFTLAGERMNAHAGLACFEARGCIVSTTACAVSCSIACPEHDVCIVVTCGSHGQHFMQAGEDIVPMNSRLMSKSLNRSNLQIPSTNMHTRKRMKNEHVAAIRNVMAVNSHTDTVLSSTPVGSVWKTNMKTEKHNLTFYSFYCH